MDVTISIACVEMGAFIHKVVPLKLDLHFELMEDHSRLPTLQVLYFILSLECLV